MAVHFQRHPRKPSRGYSLYLRLIAQTFQLASISRLRNPDFGTRHRALAQFSQPSSPENFKSTAIDETIGGGCARMGAKRKAPKSALDFYVQKNLSYCAEKEDLWLL